MNLPAAWISAVGARCLFHKDVVYAWATMIFIVVTVILVPATFRWHWWRNSSRAFVLSIAALAALISQRKLFAGHWSASRTLLLEVLSGVLLSAALGWLTRLRNGRAREVLDVVSQPPPSDRGLTGASLVNSLIH